MTGKYGPGHHRMSPASLGSATVLGLGGFIFMMLRRERHAAHLTPGGLPKHAAPTWPEAASAIARTVDYLYFYLDRA